MAGEGQNLLLVENGILFFASDNVTIINYAAYQAELVLDGTGVPVFSSPIHEMWQFERHFTLLMGEIPRLSDNTEGYGPKGTGYIAHVDIPEKVMEAFQYLKENHEEYIRKANLEYAG